MSDDTERKTHIQIGPKEPARTELASFFNGLRWFGIGTLTHAFLIGPRFDPNSLWSWGYLLAWPIPLAWFVLTWVGWLLSLMFWVVLWVGSVLCVLWGAREIWKQVQVLRANAAEARRRDENRD